MLLLLVLFSSVNDGQSVLVSLQGTILSSTALILSVCGLGFIMTGGGIDFSIGYQISLISAVISILSVRQFSDGVVVLGALAVGVLCGLANGLLVGYFEIPPFAATIATQVVFRGASYLLTQGNMISSIADSVRKTAKTYFLTIRLDVWLAVAGAVALWLFLRGTFWGMYLRAIGLNEARAGRAGIPVRRIKCLSYCIASLFYTAAAVVMISRYGYAGSEIGPGMDITSIVAAYIGGAFALAEKRRVHQLLLGALVVIAIERELPQAGVSAYLQYLITGVFLILSLMMRRKRSSGQKTELWQLGTRRAPEKNRTL